MIETTVNPESVAEGVEQMPVPLDPENQGGIDEKYYPPCLELLMRGTTDAVLGPRYDWIEDGQDYCA